jgi:Flp pilus assembly protein TadG
VIPHDRQRGTTTVEFAVAGVALFMVLFASVEVARMMYARSLLEEGVRRGARLAAVCPLNDPAIAARATFNTGNGAILPGLTTANMRVEYLNATGTVLGNPGGAYSQIQYVRVSVQNYTMPLLIPFMNAVFQANSLSSTLPRESLGVSPGAVTAC